MGTKMKGIYKGVKYGITNMFAVKEPEMEIGGPTDVKHVAHIGMDGSSGNAPSWMNEYKTGNDFATTSIGNSASGSGSTGMSPWSSREFGDSVRHDENSTEAAPVKKKERRKKPRSNNVSSPKSSNGSCSSRPSRQGKQKTKFMENNAKATNIQVV
ncbi:CRIB domain-containing protein RIC10-like isoform X1 [Salvia hispanica]|uniref:CRIB domain-containing protein RIC10-like isoform X1 n=1 Tax=Salvia hispanica TaxID=49212 RepID=UPI002009866D|nr:CRIB domain-containing protein RIC10-like isoform X1 [Salvia hispanica]XP_047964345.1 CRIB domain-containing protein RIC10-like isoform X1 [Salvia hispanica]